jgi:hypothetical protein
LSCSEGKTPHIQGQEQAISPEYHKTYQWGSAASYLDCNSTDRPLVHPPEKESGAGVIVFSINQLHWLHRTIIVRLWLHKLVERAVRSIELSMNF